MVAVSAKLLGDRVQFRPVGGEVDTERDIVPANPWRPVVVTVEVPVEPARMETLTGLAPIAKSWTV